MTPSERDSWSFHHLPRDCLRRTEVKLGKDSWLELGDTVTLTPLALAREDTEGFDCFALLPFLNQYSFTLI